MNISVIYSSDAWSQIEEALFSLVKEFFLDYCVFNIFFFTLLETRQCHAYALQILYLLNTA